MISKKNWRKCFLQFFFARLVIKDVELEIHPMNLNTFRALATWR
jgi:hypothetical protein